MILLSSIIKTFEQDFFKQYKKQILPSHYKALAAMKSCRSKHGPRMLVACPKCNHQAYIPHSCGHRNCPHCQHHASQQWLERQIKKCVPGDYFLLTFTLPAEFRHLAWNHQRKLYSLMMKSCWETVRTFTFNDKQLKGVPGAIAVLHTHSRKLDFHPHVHLIMPAAAIDVANKLWRTKTTRRKRGGDNKKKPFLFNHFALASVFRGKMLAGIENQDFALPQRHPEKWVVDCKSVGSGEKALTYLGRYLYRGVIAQKDIVKCAEGKVTFKYQNSKTKTIGYRTVTGTKFLWLVLQHVLPRRFRRARNFGFLHHNSKRLIQLLQLLLKFNPNKALAWMKKRPKIVCPRCKEEMIIIKTRIMPIISFRDLVPT